jgi:hypothetical protein
MVRTLCNGHRICKERSITKNKGIEACIQANHAYNNKNIQGDNHDMTLVESWFWISFFFCVSTKQRLSLDI